MSHICWSNTGNYLVKHVVKSILCAYYYHMSKFFVCACWRMHLLLHSSPESARLLVICLMNENLNNTSIWSKVNKIIASGAFLKTFRIFKCGTKTPLMAVLYSITIRHLLYGKNQKPAQSNHIWTEVLLWRDFIRQLPVQDHYFWVVPRVVFS